MRRVKNVAVGGMEKVVHGKMTIARVSGGMLSNVTFEKVVITDSAGAPFVSVDSFTTRLLDLGPVSQAYLLDHAVFVRPIVVLDRTRTASGTGRAFFRA